MNIIVTIKQNIRWDSWAQGKVPLFCTIMFYLILKHSMYSNHVIADFILFLGYAVLSSIYGYLVNDLFDIDIDRKHGKKNVFEKLGFFKGSVVVFIILMISILFGVRFLSKDYFLILWIIWIFSSTFYSARPLRFKERGAIGLFVAFMAQYPVPLLLCFSAFEGFGSLDMWGIILFATVSGATLEIGHQRFDLERDDSTDTRTFAVRTGQKKVDRLYKSFLFCDLGSVLGMLLIMAWNIPHVYLLIRKFNVFIPPVLIYLILSFIVMSKMFWKSSDLLDPYYVEGRQDILNITYMLFPNFFLPFYLSCILFMQYYMFLFLVLIFLFITYVNYPRANFLWPIRIIFHETGNLLRK